MKSTVICLILCVTIINANPIIITFINEIQTAPDNQEAIELHITPYGNSYPIDISGWRIQSNAGFAIINQGVTIPPDGFVVIDATNTTGIFNLNDTADVVSLYNNQGFLMDRVVYPSFPASWQGGPAPPVGSSISLYRSPVWSSIYWDRVNWYVDLSPSLGLPNDNWSSISGTIFNSQGQPMSNRIVIANGPTGGMNCLTDANGNYTIAGLGEGKYWITIWNTYNQQAGNYYDSVYVGYNQNVTGVNIIIPMTNIEQENIHLIQENLLSMPNPIKNNTAISLSLEKNTVLKIYDASGKLVKAVHNNQGPIKLSFNSGIYFLKINLGNETLTRKIISVK
ncbi:MAG: T9SS type A sorting domain-containing protein [candidate division WOR-3 bacterium]